MATLSHSARDVRGRTRGDARVRGFGPQHAGLAAVLALSGALQFVRLSQNGFANVYYSAAVHSMLRSWRNFFFVSADPGGMVSVDKPPIGLWLQAASAKLFGFTPLSLLIPEGICALLAVALLYRLVARRFGPWAGVLSALALAVFPSFVASARDNNLDALLILLMLAACGAALAAVDTGRTRWVLASAALVGLAFNTKSLAALLCVPGIGAAYLCCGAAPLRKRLVQLVGGVVVLVAISLSWSLAVDLTPASQRPFVGGSTNNSEVQLEFGYNGFGRVGGEVGGPGRKPASHARTPLLRPGITTPLRAHQPPVVAPARPRVHHQRRRVRSRAGRHRRSAPIPFGGSPSLVRIWGVGLGDQGGWDVPLALVALVSIAAVLARRRGLRGDPRVAALLALGGWFVVELLTLDFSRGIVHPYYASALGPGLAFMVGAGAVTIGRLASSRDDRRAAAGFLLAVTAAVATVAVQLMLIAREGYPTGWRIPLIALSVLALAAIPLLRRRSLWAVAGLTVTLLVAPAVYATSVWDAPVSGTFPTAGPYNYEGTGGTGATPLSLPFYTAVARYVRSHGPTHRFPLLVETSDVASPMNLLGFDAAALGGYNSTDPALSGAGLARLVAAHQARYVLLGGPFSQRGGNRGSIAAQLVCPEIPKSIWAPPTHVLIGGYYLLDCRGRERELRAPRAFARAFLRRHPKVSYPLRNVLSG